MAGWYKQLPQSAVIKLTGDDAAKVLNNMFTNDVVSLAEGQSIEGFLTNVRGWSVAFGVALRTPGGILLLCQHPAPQSIADHIDRYIIREDAVITNESAVSHITVVSSHAAAAEALQNTEQSVVPARIVGSEAGFIVDLTGASDESSLESTMLAAGFEQATDSQFSEARIRAMWPFAGAEIGEKTIPQEMDRDATAISFTKGCYLGQETIARLDARGQLQKKLCLIELDSMPSSSELAKDNKPAGQITSTCSLEGGRTVALAILKRGNFEAGTQLSCGESTAIVLEPNCT